MNRYALGIDVGGTFTDFVQIDEQGGGRTLKIPSTPHDPSEAVMAGLGELAEAEGLATGAYLRALSRIVHGTTVTTNAVLTGKMARTGLLATAGFRDTLAMRRGMRERLYDNKYRAPTPIVPRHLRRPVRGRIDYAGREVAPLSLADVDAAAAAFSAANVDAVAVCLLHAHANPDHESRAATRLRSSMPGVHIAVSSEIMPEIRYYERMSTTVLSAAVGPVLDRYLAALDRHLAESGFAGALLIMQSNGGVTTPASAARRGAATLLSGPAAAPAASLSCLAPLGERSVITIDMGGTSFEASLVRDGKPSVTTSGTVDRFAMALPAMDIKTIGAGGGSIGRIDAGGLLRMGPDSAGARPGPACYGLGGTRPTCTDADLLLGYLAAGSFAGGRLALERSAAERAIEHHIAAPLGLGVRAAAAGMYRVMNVNMAEAIRAVSVERGHDPREFPLVCAGGAGPVHAAMIAEELGMTRILVPRDASVLCAAGMLRADLRHDHVRSCASPFPPPVADAARIRSLAADMEFAAARQLAAAGVPVERRRFAHGFEMRYAGQYHEVLVDDVPRTALRDGAWEEILRRFHRTHELLYGYALNETGAEAELVSLRLRAFGLIDEPAARPAVAADRPPIKGRRSVHLPSRDGFAAVPILDRDALPAGFAGSGPAVIEGAMTTTFVPDGFDFAVDRLGSLILDRVKGR